MADKEELIGKMQEEMVELKEDLRKARSENEKLVEKLRRLEETANLNN